MIVVDLLAPRLFYLFQFLTLWRLFSYSLPEECLAERAVALVAGVEPLADAIDMELVVAVLAGKGWQTAVRAVQNAVADRALLHTVHLVVNVLFPKQDRADDVTITRLDQVADGKRPLADLASLELELICEVNHN